MVAAGGAAGLGDVSATEGAVLPYVLPANLGSYADAPEPRNARLTRHVDWGAEPNAASVAHYQERWQ
jgi:hypothetical protein